MMNRIRGLDGLRALACLLVIAHHIIPRLPQSESLISKAVQLLGHWSQAGVSIFFVLSGFLLAIPFWQASYENRLRPSFRAYVLKRFARILPGFYLAIAVSFVLSITVFDYELGVEAVVRLVSGMLFVNSYSPVTLFPTELNGPLWSIGFEVTSYFMLLGLLFVALKVFNIKRYGALVSFFWLSTLAVIAAHLIWRALVGIPQEGVGWEFGLIGYARTWVPDTNIFSLYAHFHIGVLAGALFPWVKNQKPSLKFDGLWLIVTAGLIGVLGFAILFTPFSLPGLLHLKYFWPLFPLVFAVALVLLPATKISARLLEAAWLRFIAKISFGLYIWHMVWVDLTAKFLFPEYVYGGGTTMAIWLEATLVAMTFTAITAWMSWTYIEQPVLNWAREMLKRSPSLEWQRIRTAD